MKKEQNSTDRSRQPYGNAKQTKDTEKKGQTHRMAKHEQPKHRNNETYNRDWQDENGY